MSLCEACGGSFCGVLCSRFAVSANRKPSVAERLAHKDLARAIIRRLCPLAAKMTDAAIDADPCALWLEAVLNERVPMKDKACVRCGAYTVGSPYCSYQCANGRGRRTY